MTISRSKSRHATCVRPLLAGLAAVVLTQCSPQHGADQPEPSAPPAPLAAGDARSFTKLIEGSVSPDDRFAVAVGTADRSRPVWQSVSHDGEQSSFMLADQANTATYLVSLEDFKALARLDSSHPGTAPFYNHQAAAFHWSLDARWLVEEHQRQWDTAQCTIHRLDRNGRILTRLDLIPVAKAMLLDEMLRSVEGARPEDFEDYCQIIKVISIANDGLIRARLSAGIPNRAGGPHLKAMMAAKLTEGANGGLSLKAINR